MQSAQNGTLQAEIGHILKQMGPNQLGTAGPAATGVPATAAPAASTAASGVPLPRSRPDIPQTAPQTAPAATAQAYAAPETPENVPGFPGSTAARPGAIQPHTPNSSTEAHGAARAAAGGQNNTSVPQRVLAGARDAAKQGGPRAVQQWMANNGHPRSGKWCGEFTAAVMNEAHAPIPDHPETASNWLNWGQKTATPQPGGIAVNRRSYIDGSRVNPGQAGGHVTTIESVDPDGTIHTIGGNQRSGIRGTIPPGEQSHWEFRAQTDTEVAGSKQQPKSTTTKSPKPTDGITPAQRKRLDDLSKMVNTSSAVPGNIAPTAPRQFDERFNTDVNDIQKSRPTTNRPVQGIPLGKDWLNPLDLFEDPTNAGNWGRAT